MSTGSDTVEGGLGHDEVDYERDYGPEYFLIEGYLSVRRLNVGKESCKRLEEFDETDHSESLGGCSKEGIATGLLEFLKRTLRTLVHLDSNWLRD